MVSSNRDTVGWNCNNCIRLISVKSQPPRQKERKTPEIAYQVFPNCDRMGSCQPVLALGSGERRTPTTFSIPKNLSLPSSLGGPSVIRACNPVGGGSAFCFAGEFNAGWCELCNTHEACQHCVSTQHSSPVSISLTTFFPSLHFPGSAQVRSLVGNGKMGGRG